MSRIRFLRSLALPVAALIALACARAPAPGPPAVIPAEPHAAPLLLTLPAPTGPDQVGVVPLQLIDRSRTDPWVPGHQVRQLMISIWYPARAVAGHRAVPWLEPAAAADFEQAQHIPPGLVRLPVTAGHLDAPVERRPARHPVVLFSPGSREDRSVGTALVEDLASHGYIVVTIDHTHDSGEVEFPGGRVEVSTLPPDSDQVNTEATTVRVADTRFVLGQLAEIAAGRDPDSGRRPLPAGLAGALDLSEIGMFGHSIGGATTAGAMLADSRIKAGVDLPARPRLTRLPGDAVHPLTDGIRLSPDGRDPAGQPFRDTPGPVVRREPERSAPAAGARLPRSPSPWPRPDTCGSPPGPGGRPGRPGPSR